MNRFCTFNPVQSKRIIVSVTNDLFTDNRVRKVCEFLVKHNYQVTLVGRVLKDSQDMPSLPYKTKRFWLPFKQGAFFYASYNLRLFFYLIFHKADVLLANDLDTLLANHWARKFKRSCELVYDAHEYFTGVPELVNRPRVQRVWKRIERSYLPRVSKMYTVNESIATLYRNEYHREILVVRNISDNPANIETKSRAELGLPIDKKIIILQGAGINVDRGAEELTEAMKLIPKAVLIIVGHGDVIADLQKKVKDEGLENRVLFFGKKPYHVLLNFTRVADIGVSLDKNTNINYRYSLPNKIFDYIHSSIPVVVSDLPELRNIVTTYQVGLVTRGSTATDIAQALEQLIENDVLYQTLKDNTRKASENLTWENECKVLEKIYL